MAEVMTSSMELRDAVVYESANYSSSSGGVKVPVPLTTTSGDSLMSGDMAIDYLQFRCGECFTTSPHLPAPLQSELGYRPDQSVHAVR